MSQRISSEVKKVLKKDSQGRLVTKTLKKALEYLFYDVGCTIEDALPNYKNMLDQEIINSINQGIELSRKYNNGKEWLGNLNE
jgi:hypothetical protein